MSVGQKFEGFVGKQFSVYFCPSSEQAALTSLLHPCFKDVCLANAMEDIVSLCLNKGHMCFLIRVIKIMSPSG